MAPAIRAAFADPAATRPLAEALESCVDGPARLSITYDLQTREGRILLDGIGLRCELGTVGPALARYRDAVALAEERRIATFRAGVRLDGCTRWLTGQIPPDGSRWTDCY